MALCPMRNDKIQGGIILETRSRVEDVILLISEQHHHVSRLLQQLAIELTTAVSETRSRLLWCNIPLRLSHQLIPDQELAHGGRPEKRRIEVHMEPAHLGLFLRAIQRRLVDARTCSTSLANPFPSLSLRLRLQAVARG